jgi:hypothetical protein
MDEELRPEVLQTESDVEQKFIRPLLTGAPPRGLGYNVAELFTKPNIRDFEIDKGRGSKRYFPDYVISLVGIPVMILEAKRPGEDLLSAAREARLYAAELNALYPSEINPCQFCVVSNGLDTQTRAWDSDDILGEFVLNDAVTITPSFGTFVNLAKAGVLRASAARIRRELRPDNPDEPGTRYGIQIRRDRHDRFAILANMEELGKAMGGKGNLAILIGELSDEPAHGRTDGIKQVVKEQFPNIKVTREQIGPWKREQGKTIMEDWLASGQQIGGVAANNDEMALGALQAIKASGKIGRIPVGGTDGTQ